MNPTHIKQANSFLLFSALSEIMLDLYGQTNILAMHDPLLLQKFKNLKPSLEKVSKKVHEYFTEEEIKIFYHLTNALEYLVQTTGDPSKLYEITSLITAHKNQEITMINTREELLQIANQEDTDINLRDLRASAVNHEKTSP